VRRVILFQIHRITLDHSSRVSNSGGGGGGSGGGGGGGGGGFGTELFIRDNSSALFIMFYKKLHLQISVFINVPYN
jgi:hypothetical protein